MGVGINAANQLVGTIGAVGVASRMIGSEMDQSLSEGSRAADAHAKDSARAKELPNEIDNADLYLKEETRAAEMAKSKAESQSVPLKQRLKAADLYVQKQNSIEKAAIALQNLQDEQIAVQERLKRQAVAMERGRKWGGKY
jgi:hypothetical protein